MNTTYFDNLNSSISSSATCRELRDIKDKLSSMLDDLNSELADVGASPSALAWIGAQETKQAAALAAKIAVVTAQIARVGATITSAANAIEGCIIS